MNTNAGIDIELASNRPYSIEKNSSGGTTAFDLVDHFDQIFNSNKPANKMNPAMLSNFVAQGFCLVLATASNMTHAANNTSSIYPVITKFLTELM